MRIIKQGPGKSTKESLRFFKDHYLELGEIKYIILYYAEREWAIYRDREIYHQYVIIVGEKAQLWMSGLTWGYDGTGPYAFFTIMQLIDPNITYKDIAALEWMAEDPIVYEKMNGKLVLTHFDETAKNMICNGNKYLPWEIRGIKSFIIRSGICFGSGTNSSLMKSIKLVIVSM